MLRKMFLGLAIILASVNAAEAQGVPYENTIGSYSIGVPVDVTFIPQGTGTRIMVGGINAKSMPPGLTATFNDPQLTKVGNLFVMTYSSVSVTGTPTGLPTFPIWRVTITSVDDMDQIVYLHTYQFYPQ